jgi:hypothetical protein
MTRPHPLPHTPHVHRSRAMKPNVHRIHFAGIGVETSGEQCLPPSGGCDRPRVARAADGLLVMAGAMR